MQSTRATVIRTRVGTG
jgi:hypothetical protein